MRFFIPVLVAGLLAAALSCTLQKKAALLDPPIITSASYQHTLYNGRGQDIEAEAAKEDAPRTVTYYTSAEDYETGANGFSEAPSAVGVYYARIRRPAGNGYREGPDIKVEYHIQKALPE
jgi:hypothetical protein